jgi:hypothetical protein
VDGRRDNVAIRKKPGFVTVAGSRLTLFSSGLSLADRPVSFAPVGYRIDNPIQEFPGFLKG